MRQHLTSALRRQQGFSLMELAVALVVLGLLSVAAVTFWRSTQQQRISALEADVMTRAQQSVLGFVYTPHRLPCPATDRREVVPPRLPLLGGQPVACVVAIPHTLIV